MAARGYLGKISAVVSVNASSVGPTLSSTAKQITSWAKSTRSTIDGATSSANRSFNGMFTSLQKLQRALRDAQSDRLDLNFDRSARGILALREVAESLAKPVGESAKQFQTLSDTVQRQFYPALTSVQDAVSQMRQRIDSGVIDSRESFQALKADVDQVVGAIGRLNETASLSGRLLSGRELTLVRPEVVDTLNRVAEAQKRLTAAPASVRGSPIARDLVEDAQILQQQITKISARIERLNSQGLDIRVSQAGLDLALRRLREVASLTDEIAQAEQQRQAAAQRVAEAEIALLQRKGRAEREFYEESQRLRQQALADQRAEAEAAVAPIIARARAEQEAYEEGQRLRQQALADQRAEAEAAVAPIIARARAEQEAYEEGQRLRQQALADQRAEAEAAAAPIIARARAEQEAYEEGQRLRQQALADQRAEAEAAVAPIIARARAEQEAYEEGQRLRQQALADQRALAEEASQLLVVDQQESAVLSNQGASSRRATPLPPGYFDDGFNRQIRGELGAAIDDPQRQIDRLRGSVVSLKSQLDTLPVAVRAQFVPAIQAAEAEFRRIRAQPRATAEEIENAANEVDRLSQQLQRVSRVQAIPNFADSLNDTALRGAIGNLNALQQVLSRVGAEAGGELAQQFDRMRAIVQRATQAGTLGTREFEREMQDAAREAANLAAQTGRISANAAFRQIQRGGDIARGGFDNLSLAVQQAAFAIDDFFSATGDFTQRIRAVQNNVTQLAFILGGTQGLFIGLAASITAQAGVALYNWINAGRTAEDQTKALNDALARQKSLVEELAQAFESLGDAIARRALSEPAQQARQFAKEIDAIAKKQRELREGRIADLDPGVQRERATQNRVRRDLESATDLGQRGLLQAELAASQAREARARQAAVNQRPMQFADLRALVSDTVDAETAVRSRGLRRIDRAAVERQRAAAIENLGDGSDLRVTREGIQNRLSGLRNSPVANDRVIREAALQLERQLAVIDGILASAADKLAQEIIRSSMGAAVAIEQAQNDVANAISSGVVGARIVQQQLNSLGASLEQAFADLEAARRSDNADEQARLQGEAERRIREITANQNAVIRLADDLRFTQTVDPQRTLEARLQRTQQNLQSAGLEGGQFARRLREIAFQRETLRQQAEAFPNDPVFARAANQADAAMKQEVAEIEAATIALNRFSEALNRASQEAQQNLSSAQQAADQARREDLGFSTPRSREERAAADAALQRQVELERRVQVEVANARGRLEVQAGNDPVLRGAFQRIRDINEQLASGSLGSKQQEALRNERAAIEASIDARVSTDPRVTQARDASTQEEEQRQAAIRGRRLSQTPGQRAAEEFARGVEDIRQAFGQAAAEGTGLIDIEGQNEAIQRFAQDQFRQTAPAIFNLADSVQNAILQGPSRAALNVSDISTQDGARELNRLLRGDDSARDQNLVELQRQSTALEDIQRTLREGVNGVKAA